MNTELIKEAAVKYNDSELLRLAQEIEKEAGFLSAAGEGITKALFNAGKKDAANIAQKTVGQAVSETGSLLKDKIKQFGNNQIQAGVKAGQKFSHTLKDGTKITQEQFAKLGPSAKMYATPLTKTGMEKNAGEVSKAFRLLFKAFRNLASSAKGNLKNKVKGIKSGFKHGDIQEYNEALEKQVSKKGATAKKLHDQLINLNKKHSAEALAGQKAEAEYGRKIGNKKALLGLGTGLGIGAGSVALYNKKKNYYV